MEWTRYLVIHKLVCSQHLRLMLRSYLERNFGRVWVSMFGQVGNGRCKEMLLKHSFNLIVQWWWENWD